MGIYKYYLNKCLPCYYYCIIDFTALWILSKDYARVQGKEQRKEVQQTHHVVKRGLAAWLSASVLLWDAFMY